MRSTAAAATRGRSHRAASALLLPALSLLLLLLSLCTFSVVHAQSQSLPFPLDTSRAPSFAFTAGGVELDASGQRVQRCSDSSALLVLEDGEDTAAFNKSVWISAVSLLDEGRVAPSFDARLNASSFGGESWPSVMELRSSSNASGLAGEEEAVVLSYAEPCTLFLATFIPASSFCFRSPEASADPSISPAVGCMLYGSGQGTNAGDLVVYIRQEEPHDLVASLRVSVPQFDGATNVSVVSTPGLVVPTDQLALFCIHFDGQTLSVMSRLNGSAPIDVSSGITVANVTSTSSADISSLAGEGAFVPNTTSNSFLGGPQDLAHSAAAAEGEVNHAMYTCFDGELLAVVGWVEPSESSPALTTEDRLSVFEWLLLEYEYVNILGARVPVFPPRTHGPDFVLATEGIDHSSLAAEGRNNEISLWRDMASLVRAEAGMLPPAARFDAVPYLVSGLSFPAVFDSARNATLFSTPLVSLFEMQPLAFADSTQVASIDWSSFTVALVVRVDADSPCLRQQGNTTTKGCMVWSTRGLLELPGDAAIYIDSQGRLSVSVVLSNTSASAASASAGGVYPEASISLQEPLPSDSTFVLLAHWDSFHLELSLQATPANESSPAEKTQSVRDSFSARDGVSASFAAPSTESGWLGGPRPLTAAGVSTNATSAFGNFVGRMMEIQGYLGGPMLSVQERNDVVDHLRTKWAWVDSVVVPAAVLPESSSSSSSSTAGEGNSSSSSSTGDIEPVSSTAAADVSSSTANEQPFSSTAAFDSSSSTGSAPPSPVLSYAPLRVTFHFLLTPSPFLFDSAGAPRPVDTWNEIDMEGFQEELGSLLHLERKFFLWWSSEASPENSVSIDLYSSGDARGAPHPHEPLLKRAIPDGEASAVGASSPQAQVDQLNAWRTDPASVMFDTTRYHYLSQLDAAKPFTVAPISEEDQASPSGWNSLSALGQLLVWIAALVVAFSCLVALCTYFVLKRRRQVARTHNKDRGGGPGELYAQEDEEMGLDDDGEAGGGDRRSITERERERQMRMNKSKGKGKRGSGTAGRAPLRTDTRPPGASLDFPRRSGANEIRSPSGMPDDDEEAEEDEDYPELQLREVSLHEEDGRDRGLHLGGILSSQQHGAREEDDDGAEEEEHAAWAALSPSSRAAKRASAAAGQGHRDTQAIELQARPVGRGGNGSSVRAVPAASSAHVIAADFPLAHEYEDDDAFEDHETGAFEPQGRINQSSAFPVRLHHEEDE